jgi:YHS domain-containing protein
MTTHRLQLAAVLMATLVPAVAAVQHEAHQATSGPESADIAQCARVAPLVDNIIAAAMARTDSARQSNSPSAMRAAIDDLDTSLRDIRAQLEPCKAAAAVDPHAGHTMPGMQHSPAAAVPANQPPPNVADPHAGHSMVGQQADMPMDPVNGAMVNPATAPKATYRGKTYYFSSEHRERRFWRTRRSS